MAEGWGWTRRILLLIVLIWCVAPFWPGFGAQRQFIEFGTGFAPMGIVAVKKGNEAIAMVGLQQVGHFVKDDVFEQILRFLDEFSVEPNMASPMVATAPSGLHPLKKVAFYCHPQLGLPFANQGGNHFMEEGLMPLMEDLRPFGGITAGANAKGDASVVKGDARFSLGLNHGE